MGENFCDRASLSQKPCVSFVGHQPNGKDMSVSQDEGDPFTSFYDARSFNHQPGASTLISQLSHCGRIGRTGKYANREERNKGNKTQKETIGKYSNDC